MKRALFFIALSIGLIMYANAGNQEIKVKKGEIFNIELAWDPLTGLKWQMERNKDKNECMVDSLRRVSTTVPTRDPIKTFTNTNKGKDVWTFRATKEGRDTINLKYPCHYKDKPYETKKIYVTVE